MTTSEHGSRPISSGFTKSVFDGIAHAERKFEYAMSFVSATTATVSLAVSVAGVAGPGGGSAEKPVGLVIFGLARRGRPCRTERRIFTGDRSAIRRTAVHHALGLLDAEARR